jgi:surfactin synthase thioesterase subunit
MLAFNGDELCKALLVSPILDMEKLICDMMARAGVMENELQEKGEITTKFGETLSWRYLTWVRKHPVNNWSCPTAVLYAGQDNMTSRETVDAFVAEKHAALTVMENGEHWFHTPQQMEVLTAWEQENM